MADITATGPLATTELDRLLTAGYTISTSGTAVTVSALGHTSGEVTAAILAAGGSDPRPTVTDIRDRAGQALTTNTTFLAIASPTNAQLAAQVKALTRQNNGLIRLVLNRFDGTD